MKFMSINLKKRVRYYISALNNSAKFKRNVKPNLFYNGLVL